VEVVKDMGLAPGEELAPSRHEVLLHAASVEAARQVALRMLGVRPHAVTEISRKLRDRGHDARAIEGAVARLEGSGLLNDADFARHFARVRAPKGHGPSRLVHDLLTRGVARAVAEGAVSEVASAEEFDPGRAARTLAEKRAAALRSLPVAVRKRRVLAYLARRGFRSREVREMVNILVQHGGETGKGKREK